MAKKSVAIISVGNWGKRIAWVLHKDKRFKLVSLIGNFGEDVWRHAPHKTPLEPRNGWDKGTILKKIAEHGLIPTIQEAEAEEDSEVPEAHKKTVDIVIVDMDLDEMSSMNSTIATALKNHVKIRIVAHAFDLDQKKQLEVAGAVAIRPYQQSADAIVPMLINTHITNIGDELGDWDGAIMPVPSCWTGRTVSEVEQEFGIVVFLVQSEETIMKKGKSEETSHRTFASEKSYMFTDKDIKMKIASNVHENILKVEREIDKT